MKEQVKTKITESAPYTLPYEELKKYLKDFKEESNRAHTKVAFIDVDSRLGMFRRSDFIIIYNSDSMPIVVTERINKCNYGIFEWWRIKRSLKSKKNNIYQEYGYDITIDIHNTFIHCTHYRGDMLSQITPSGTSGSNDSNNSNEYVQCFSGCY